MLFKFIKQSPLFLRIEAFVLLIEGIFQKIERKSTFSSLKSGLMIFIKNNAYLRNNFFRGAVVGRCFFPHFIQSISFSAASFVLVKTKHAAVFTEVVLHVRLVSPVVFIANFVLVLIALAFAECIQRPERQQEAQPWQQQQQQQPRRQHQLRGSDFRQPPSADPDSGTGETKLEIFFLSNFV